MAGRIRARRFEVAAQVRPSKLFLELVEATGLPESIVRFLVTDVLDDPDVVPEALTVDQLAHVGPVLLRIIDVMLLDEPAEVRREAHRRLDALLHAIPRGSAKT